MRVYVCVCSCMCVCVFKCFVLLLDLVFADKVLILNLVERDVHPSFLAGDKHKDLLIINRGGECKTICTHMRASSIFIKKKRNKPGLHFGTAV